MKAGGPELLAAAGEFMQGEIDTASLKKASEKAPDLELIRNEALQSLIDNGLIDVAADPEDGRKVYVIDPEKIATIANKTDAQKYFSKIYRDEHLGGKLLAKTLALIFRDVSSITTKQLEDRDFSEKPFLYIPHSSEAAFDPKQIKSAQFQTTLWDLLTTRDAAEKECPVADGVGPSMLETRLATTIFHPTYGDGYRDNKGALLIRDAQTRQYQKISSNLLEDYGIPHILLTKEGGKSIRSFRQGIEKYAPELTQRGLLHPEDFREVGRMSEPGEYYTRPVRSEITGPYVMFGGVNHYIGRSFIGNGRAVQLTPTHGGIIQKDSAGNDALTYIFNIVPKQQTTPGKFPITKKDQTKPHAFDPKIDTDPVIHNFAEALNISNQLRATGITIETKDAAEDDRLVNAEKNLRQYTQQGSLASFARKVGRQGLELLLKAGDDAVYAESILVIGEKLTEGKARGFFSEMSAGQLPQDWIRELEPEAQEIAQSVIASAIREHLIEYAHNLTGGDAGQSPELAIKKAKADIKLLLNTVRLAQNSSSPKKSFEDFKGAEILIRLATELSARDKTEMLEIFRKTHTNLSVDVLEGEVEELRGKMDSSENRFYIIRQAGTIAAFVRFEDLPNGNVYAGSFNVDERMQTSGIGTAFLRAAFNKENEAKEIEALVDPDKKRLIEFYQEVFKFQLTGEKEESNGKTYLKMILPIAAGQLRAPAQAA